jgi:importin-7
LTILESANTRALRLANLEVLINCVLYNPTAALHIMESIQPRTSKLVFDKWFEAIENHAHLPRVHDKKLCIMALCALLEMDPAAIPEPVREGWPQIVAGALHVFKDLPRAIEGAFRL